MKPATLGLIYLFKFSELIFLMIWTVLVWQSCISFTQTVWAEQEKEMRDFILMGLLPLCCVLSLFNLFYNNLFINLRFKSKMKSVTLGLCCFDAINYCICYCFLVKPCRDRCLTPWSVVKWVIKAVIFGTTVYLIQEKKSEWEDAFDVGSLDLERLERTRLDTYLIIYLLQHPLFLAARPIAFLIFSLVTCCCDKGTDLPEDFKFEDRILSFDFVEYELGQLNNFEDHPVGRQEYEFNRRLSFVRAQSIRGRPPAPELKRSGTIIGNI